MEGGRFVGRSLVLAVAAALAAAACSSPVSSGPPAPRAGADLVVGIPINATGSLSQEGALTKQGYDLWLDWANHSGGIVVQGVRHRVRLVYEDDQSSPQVAAQATEKLLTGDGAQLLLGPYGSVDAAGAADVADM